MLAVPEVMVKPILKFLARLFSGELRDPEELSIAIQSLAMAAMPEAHKARLLRAAYRRSRADVATFGDDGWTDRARPGEVIPFARRDAEETLTGQ
jgi:hypothetical protein